MFIFRSVCICAVNDRCWWNNRCVSKVQRRLNDRGVHRLLCDPCVRVLKTSHVCLACSDQCVLKGRSMCFDWRSMYVYWVYWTECLRWLWQDECKAKYGLPVYYRFLRCFELMPLCAVVANNHGRYFCTHGGISPGLTSFDQITALDRRWADCTCQPTVCYSML